MSLKIAGTGRYLPEFVLRNEDFEAFLDTSDEWITTRTGMKERRISTGEPTWRMGELAAREALFAADIAPEEIDLILCSTVTGDFRYPSCSCMIQRALGAKNAFAMDIAAACTGSVYALDMARRYLVTGDVDTVLVVGSEWLTQQVDYTDRANCILFGDGAGAAVVRRGEGLYGGAMRSNPDGAHTLYDAFPRHDYPFAKLTPTEGGFPVEQTGALWMDGREVYKFATRAMPEAVIAACDKAGIAVGDLDLIIPHQANLRIIEAAAARLKVPMEKVFVNIDRYANTSSATVLICLDACVREGRLSPGQRFCLVGFGSGLTYGAIVMEYQK